MPGPLRNGWRNWGWGLVEAWMWDGGWAWLFSLPVPPLAYREHQQKAFPKEIPGIAVRCGFHGSGQGRPPECAVFWAFQAALTGGRAWEPWQAGFRTGPGQAGTLWPTEPHLLEDDRALGGKRHPGTVSQTRLAAGIAGRHRAVGPALLSGWAPG